MRKRKRKNNHNNEYHDDNNNKNNNSFGSKRSNKSKTKSSQKNQEVGKQIKPYFQWLDYRSGKTYDNKQILSAEILVETTSDICATLVDMKSFFAFVWNTLFF